MKTIMFTHHPKMNDAQLAAKQVELEAALLDFGWEDKAELVARACYNPSKLAQTWQQWTNTAVQDLDALVLTTLRIGLAQARLANLMKTKGKPVYFYNGLEIQPVKFIKEVDSTDWKTGFMVIYGR